MTLFKLLKSILLCCAFLFVCFLTQAQVAKTPPMGWNSYNCFGSAVHEDEVKANADYMAKNLKQFGWQYIVVDFLWSYDNPPGSNLGNMLQKNLEDGSYIPWLAMDKWGRLLPQPNKFPSAFTGEGFKPLGDYIHTQGLKFGIHVMRGIPRQAVWAKSPVLGITDVTANMIADTTSICSWVNQMYGLNMSKPGAQMYLNSLLELYAFWGVDYIKVDDITHPYSPAEIEGYRKAIANCGRPIVLSLSPGDTPISQAEHVSQHGNLWRISEDFWDNWKEIVKMFEYAERWQGLGGPDKWPDCDMMQIGKLSKRGPVDQERYSKFTNDELYTHMNFWCLYRSPLMLGGNLPENREIELKLVSNDEVIAVNQQGKNPRQLYKKEGSMVWVSQVQDSKDLYVGLFNISDTLHDVTLNFGELNLKGKIAIRDLWKKTELGLFVKKYTQNINPHGSVLLRLKVK